ncbi:MAG: class I SAM-dependent methyltransferase, partial [Mycobacterium sp.]
MSMAYLQSLIQGSESSEDSTDEAELRFLADLASGPQIQTIAQIGFNAGFSAHNFLDANHDAVLYSFDIGEHNYVRPAADHIAQTFPGRSVMTYGDSVHTVPEFHRRHPEMKFDLIFIDGGHDYAVARQDLLNMRNLAHPTTVLVLDDLVPWLPWGIGPARAWADLLDEGVVTCDGLWQEGWRVKAPAPPGRRAWAVGRYVPPSDGHPDDRNVDPQKHARDLLLAESIHNPNDAQSVILLAHNYFDQGDFVKAHTWYARRVAMGGSDEEVYVAMYRIAESMARLDIPWPDVQDAYLKAWQF